ncbi:MAG: pyruvate:ferredoxin (flavodoxin) oxidoreductase [Oscillospiraceae bacterium]
MANAGRNDIVVTGGRYGLGSKDTPPSSVFAVYEELKHDTPKRQFTIGIVDDVTNLSLPEHDAPDTSAEGTIACKFWGLGGDGTVGANKNSIKIIGDHTDKYVQAYFQYDSKKTGGVTISHLRFGDHEIKSPYYINKADFVACHNPSYITKGFKMVQDVKPGGVFMINCEWTPEELSHHLDASAKRYIARNNIQLYTINAIDLAIQIGMGKRNNTILQSAFFSLAKIMPEEDAIRYMKEKAKASYMKKGEDVVEMNYKAIDLGATAYVKIDVPADWADAVDEAPAKELAGRPATVKMVRDILTPVDKMDGDSLPVSAFVDHADGTFELGASAYEKRGVAVSVPEWDSAKCIQCNQCAYVCPHATIRPFALTADELAAAPAQTKAVDFKVGAGKGVYKFSMAISPLDCMGCGVCTHVCPVGALTMQPLESQEDQQPVFDYMVAKVAEKKELQDFTVKGSQFRQPMLEFSGSCAGCAETSYARLITQLFGDHMMISNATGCSSIWGGPAATSPYTVNKEGKGPAWANSLFEDNAEHGLGMYLGQKKIPRRSGGRHPLHRRKRQGSRQGRGCEEYLETYNDGEANQTATAEFLAVMEAKPACDCERYQRVMANKDFLNKKSCWIFGGDGWAYDIGFGGLDHVLAQDEDVNVFVFNTEVYSNTGGQASKASNIGQVAQFAAAGKELKSKSLAEIAMSYGYIYVAQVAMGANPAQTIKAIKEAEAYHGPSLIIGYAPCEMHSIKKGGMTNCQGEMKRAVDCGYWNLFRYDPSAEKPFALDSKEPAGGYRDFLMNEARYARLTNEFPDRAEELFAKSEDNAKARYEHLLKLKKLYDEA